MFVSTKTYTSKKLSSARAAALQAIKETRQNKAFAKEILNKSLSKCDLSETDRAFAAKLTLGVTQTLGTLDDLIYRCVDSPDDIKDNVMDCLRISTYEIVYLEKEAHAAVDQGVELVKSVEQRARGLANLVLRRIVKLKEDFPFGDPDSDLQAFARIYATPKWLCETIFDSIGEKPGRYLVSSSNGAAPCYIFVNTLKISVGECRDLLEKNGAEPDPVDSLCGVDLPACIRLNKPSALQSDALVCAMADGLFFITDAASQAIVANFANNISSPGTFLEYCCGKGNKTLMFQNIFNQKFGEQFDFACLDNVESKLITLKHRLKKSNLKVNKAYVVNATSLTSVKRALSDDLYDYVFVDSPCSGLGTLRRHPEIKWRITNKAISELSQTCLKILANASTRVAKGGLLCYSTCTVTKAENQNVINAFLKSKYGQDFKLVPFVVNDKQLPYFYTQTFSGLNDVHFSAIFLRN